MVVDNAAADQAACRSGGVLLQKSDLVSSSMLLKSASMILVFSA
jgi:hypothetical protein